MTTNQCSQIHIEAGIHKSIGMCFTLPSLIAGLKNNDMLAPHSEDIHALSELINNVLNLVPHTTCNTASFSFGRHLERAGREKVAL